MSACEKGKQWEEAIGLLQEMVYQLLAPDVVSWNAAPPRSRIARLISSNGFGVGVYCLVPSGVCSFRRLVRDCPRPLATWDFPLAWLHGLPRQVGQEANATWAFHLHGVFPIDDWSRPSVAGLHTCASSQLASTLSSAVRGFPAVLLCWPLQCKGSQRLEVCLSLRALRLPVGALHSRGFAARPSLLFH